MLSDVEADRRRSEPYLQSEGSKHLIEKGNLIQHDMTSHNSLDAAVIIESPNFLYDQAQKGFNASNLGKTKFFIKICIKKMSVEFLITSKENMVKPYIEKYSTRDILGVQIDPLQPKMMKVNIFSKMYEELEKPQVSGCCCLKSVKDPKARTLHFVEIYCDSEADALQWQCRLTQAAYGGDPNISNQMPDKKKLYALLNPFGGMGLAPRKWEVAKEILDLSHVEYTLKQTERQNHAHDIIKNEIQIGQYDGILTISGDGLIHEAINGAMSRPDRDEFL